MKLSILIFVLTTITYGCQCAPTPDWEKDFEQNMHNMTQKMYESQQRMDESLKALRQELQNSQEQIEEQINHIGQLSNNLANETQDLNGININSGRSHSTVASSTIVNGHRVDLIIVEHVTDNVKYRTVIEYTSATGKTEIKKYECTLPPNSQCDLKSTEVIDGPPGNFFQNL